MPGRKSPEAGYLAVEGLGRSRDFIVWTRGRFEGRAHLRASLWRRPCCGKASSFMPHDPARVEETAAWPPDAEDGLFHCRQFAEKSLKVFLVWRDHRFRRKLPSGWSPDGKLLLYTAIDPKAGYDIWVLPNPLGLPGAMKPYPFPHTPFNEALGQFSPDGKWIVYQPNESGRTEIYATPFPPTAGAFSPSFRRSSRTPCRSH